MKKNLLLFFMILIFACPLKSWAEEIIPCFKINEAKEIRFSTADAFFVDTPIPLPCGRAALDFYADSFQTKEGSVTRLPALKANMGVTRDFQLHGNFPVILNAPKKGTTHYGYGDVLLGFKYRFIQETDILPAIAFYPKFTFPSGDASKGLGNKNWIARLPLWFQKQWGNWKVTPGGGYHINTAKNKFNFPYGGILFQYQITKYFMLGNEFYGEGKKSLSDKSRLSFNFGGSYFFNSSYFLAFSAGHSLAGPQRFTSFLGFGVAWGPVINP